MRLVLLLQFLLCCYSIKYSISIEYEIDVCINNGYKNFVFNLSNNHDLVLRASFVTEGNQVENFRDSIALKQFWELVDNAFIKLEGTRSMEYNVLSKILQCAALVKAKDIVPIRHLINEYKLQAKANTFSRLLLGTAGSVQRQLIKLPIELRNNTIFLAIDIQIRLAGSFETLGEKMTEVELYSLLYCYYSDQIDFKKQTGFFHVDAHPGNILFDIFEDEINFVWADFGASSSRSDSGAQFQNSLRSFHNKVFTKASGYLPVQIVLDKISSISTQYNQSYIMQVNNMERILTTISEAVLSRFQGDEKGMKSALKKMSPALGFGFDYLFEKNNDRKLEIRRQDTKIQQQDRTIQQQGSTIKQQDIKFLHMNSTIQQQDSTIQQQGSTIQQMNSTIQQQDSTIQQQGSTIKQQDIKFQQMNSTIQQQDSTIQQQGSTIQQMNSTIQHQGSTFKHQDIKFQRQDNEFVKLNNQIQAIIQLLMNQNTQNPKVMTDLLQILAPLNSNSTDETRQIDAGEDL